MAAKAHLRNNKPLLLSLSTNDALGMNMKNIGLLLNTKNIYFVPFGQDDPEKKPNSMTAHTDLLIPALEAALENRQLQPVIRDIVKKIEEGEFSMCGIAGFFNPSADYTKEKELQKPHFRNDESSSKAPWAG